ncbi:hypothetical protein [Umezawaea sp. Da 62-37]|uniref:hypothetical protein n=1 Tax=Umezawaea sp. Da 62-37 TaxID=3075927 RepID=UPI0028F7331B|nr:hypothetical protein [Umezawaea sp. Da 62-37]WNV89026.1 hypothetical protein RM788_12205 [Umezawaea sp. Da 62-37]
MSVQNGIEEYRRQHGQADPAIGEAEDLKSKPGSVAYGRVMFRAERGDEAARTVVRRQAERGHQASAATLEGAGDGLQFTGAGPELPDNMGPEAA